MRADRVEFWDTMLILLPMAAGLLPPFAVWLGGGFESFYWAGLNMTPAETFGILGAICWPVAALFYVRTQSDEILGRESLGWPTVPGRLVEWEVRPFAALLQGRLNAVTARYSYLLDGERREGELLAFGPTRLRTSPAFETVKGKYRRGMEVTLHHAPDQPDLVVLEPGDAFARERVPRAWLLMAAPVAGAIIELFLTWVF